MANNPITRRQALARLGITPAMTYVVPTILALSTAAHASSASKASNPSDPTVPTPPTPPSPPSGVNEKDDGEADERSADRCKVGADADLNNGRTVISRTDSERAQEAVNAGYAKPLNQIWRGIQDNYAGQILSVQFTGFRYRPRYRLRAISPLGQLETVIVSARTGSIIRIVGC